MIPPSIFPSLFNLLFRRRARSYSPTSSSRRAPSAETPVCAQLVSFSSSRCIYRRTNVILFLSALFSFRISHNRLLYRYKDKLFKFVHFLSSIRLSHATSHRVDTVKNLMHCLLDWEFLHFFPSLFAVVQISQSRLDRVGATDRNSSRLLTRLPHAPPSLSALSSGSFPRDKRRTLNEM